MEKFLMRNSEQPEEPVGGAKKMEGEKIAEQSTSPEVMRKYLYTFGYTTPHRPKSTDWEDTREVFIIAENSEKALEWGKHLADEYIKNLKKETGEFISKGAEWVETEDELYKQSSKEEYSTTPLLRYGEKVDVGVLFQDRL